MILKNTFPIKVIVKIPFLEQVSILIITIIVVKY